MRLPEHSRKSNEVSDDEDMNEAREHHGHRLNRVYQGSLRESGYTSQTPVDMNGASASAATAATTSIVDACTRWPVSLTTICIILIVSFITT